MFTWIEDHNLGIAYPTNEAMDEDWDRVEDELNARIDHIDEYVRELIEDTHRKHPELRCTLVQHDTEIVVEVVAYDDWCSSERWDLAYEGMSVPTDDAIRYLHEATVQYVLRELAAESADA